MCLHNHFKKLYNMEQQKQNKEFIIRYFNALSGVTKTSELVKNTLQMKN